MAKREYDQHFQCCYHLSSEAMEFKDFTILFITHDPGNPGSPGNRDSIWTPGLTRRRAWELFHQFAYDYRKGETWVCVYRNGELRTAQFKGHRDVDAAIWTCPICGEIPLAYPFKPKEEK